MSAELTTVESSKLERCETVIQTGLATFMEVGAALAEIRDGKLYRQSHKTFEDYCREKWGMQKAHAYRMIAAAEAVSPIGDKSVIKSESQARELAKVEPARREEVVAAAVEATGGKVTAAAIKAAAAPLYPVESKFDWSEAAKQAEAEAARDSAKLWALKSAWRQAPKKDRAAFLEWLKTQKP